MVSARFDVRGLVITAEHASPRVPRELDDLGLPARILQSHVSWDPGTAIVGRMLARAFGAPLHLGRWSRLVVDLNRSYHNARVISEDIQPSGRRLRSNALDAEARAARLAKYWTPWRAAASADLDAAVARVGHAFHLSLHSFVERLRRVERKFEIGLLYDPGHPAERPLADRLHKRLEASGLRVRRNKPYTGLEDGHCMRQRIERPTAKYLGMEIEMNQRFVRSPEGARRFGRALRDALAPEFS